METLGALYPLIAGVLIWFSAMIIGSILVESILSIFMEALDERDDD